MSTAAANAPDAAVRAARVTGVSKTFGATRALRDVHLDVAEGEVHALVGRNGAGKSTLVSILTGLQAPDTGTVELGGVPAPPLADREAWRQRVACVYQRLTVIDELSVAENLFVNRQAVDGGRMISWKRLQDKAAELLAEWQLDIDPATTARDLTIEQKQYVEIARALSFGARFVILDEPTARLDGTGVQRLFERVRALRSQGVTFLYISHHLQEIFELCESVTVFRDAQFVRSGRVDELSRTTLVEAMTGEKAAVRSDPRPPGPDRRATGGLQLDGLAGTAYDGIDLAVRPGEIVGLAGGGGSGKFEIAEAVCGLQTPRAGTITIDGNWLRPGSVPRAHRAGVGFVPKDRHQEGLVDGLTIGDNATMSVPHRLGSHGWVSPKRQAAYARGLIKRLDIVPANPDQAAGELSGGNQQKVVAARAIADDPKVLVLMAPTAGVDVRSKESLLATAVDATERGAAVLIVTDDLEDLRYCHRVSVVFRGRQVAQFEDQWDDRDIVAAMEGVELSDD
ncbi:sugar ABC transporter ATP-binding protein [Flexivirga oryzae]|uniref:Simple sugar transport system ATP-binding protein n=1 Tax=Flexivirga oryzae TaxID=1794944 RepID=A0A839NBI6_9MICO|nr:sugar ABC transporter ATP-binding protein [Flexivirga oryzae]MBB2892996.1 simple sugar transport system ATP-binding protein [Flexivirga oryzae]